MTRTIDDLFMALGEGMGARVVATDVEPERGVMRGALFVVEPCATPTQAVCLRLHAWRQTPDVGEAQFVLLEWTLDAQGQPLPGAAVTPPDMDETVPALAAVVQQMRRGFVPDVALLAALLDRLPDTPGLRLWRQNMTMWGDAS